MCGRKRPIADKKTFQLISKRTSKTSWTQNSTVIQTNNVLQSGALGVAVAGCLEFVNIPRHWVIQKIHASMKSRVK